MSNIKIETLTAVHVGSGETFQYGNDFVRGRLSRDNAPVLGIIDAKKIMRLIGEENIDRWVTAIERKESTDQIVKVYAPHAKVEDYSKRTILQWAKVKNTDTLKEQIHDGLGRPYIPGSSIKGAIRTAVLSSIIRNSIQQSKESKGGAIRTAMLSSMEDSIDNKKKQLEEIVLAKSRPSAKEVENFFFGKDPTSDVFRFLQVGDAYFGNDYEVAVRMVNINERERQNFWDTSKSQLIEAIRPGDKAFFQMKLNTKQYDSSKQKVNQLPSCMESLSNLFLTINQHTHSLLDQEIDYWTRRTDKDDSGQVDIYMEKIENIQEKAAKCNDGKSCVLRVGHGSGWRFITGAWAEELNIFHTDIVPAARPNNKRYTQYEFPKTRRVDNECELLGFVKLSLTDG